ncbi:hypothetical protein Cob_v012606 [Colletotrichum orbiculare MAFF 240422]|uniref:Uncharacterized protein n=1 Tax=Colletotrichum orbiculare (strain 104-T / ATCC 96160 / CBS 514.97 / LARS 414 / MAFF 240422) TaxID=1213857 RepID=A0A484F878_COLOR|nr:hypothetical protein Cob_v012606 [Colletotrichum orbiculare MAFF 240422]
MTLGYCFYYETTSPKKSVLPSHQRLPYHGAMLSQSELLVADVGRPPQQETMAHSATNNKDDQRRITIATDNNNNTGNTVTSQATQRRTMAEL